MSKVVCPRCGGDHLIVTKKYLMHEGALVEIAEEKGNIMCMTCKNKVRLPSLIDTFATIDLAIFTATEMSKGGSYTSYLKQIEYEYATLYEVHSVDPTVCSKPEEYKYAYAKGEVIQPKLQLETPTFSLIIIVQFSQIFLGKAMDTADDSERFGGFCGGDVIRYCVGNNKITIG